tara:strand:- start:19375 stop:19659 length:285 start_codon:yes stop_codon:yes gene_type:complete
MIQVFFVKLIIGAIKDAIEKKKRIKGLNDLKKIDDYVNKDNVLDKQMKQVQKNVTKALRYIEKLEKNVGILKTDSHPPVKNLEKRIKWIEKKLK